MIKEDEQGNQWEGPYSIKQLEKLLTQKEVNVWYQGIANCEWTHPHYIHRMSLYDLRKNHPNKRRNIWVQTATLTGIVEKKKISPAILAAIITGTATVLGAIIAVILAYYLNSDKTPQKDSTSTNQPEVKSPKDSGPKIEGDWEWEEIEGEVDGDFVKIRIAFKIITDQFRWKRGSHEFLDNGEKVTEQLPQYLNGLPDFKNALDIVAVGMSSQENNENITLEEDRAERRADNILLALNPHEIAKEKNIYKLNLGVHRTISGLTRSEETSYQRKIVLIGIMKKSKNISFEKFRECLKEALAKTISLSFDKNNYSKFDLKTYQINYETIEY